MIQRISGSGGSGRKPPSGGGRGRGPGTPWRGSGGRGRTPGGPRGPGDRGQRRGSSEEGRERRRRGGKKGIPGRGTAGKKSTSGLLIPSQIVQKLFKLSEEFTESGVINMQSRAKLISELTTEIRNIMSGVTDQGIIGRKIDTIYKIINIRLKTMEKRNDLNIHNIPTLMQTVLLRELLAEKIVKKLPYDKEYQSDVIRIVNNLPQKQRQQLNRLAQLNIFKLLLQNLFRHVFDAINESRKYSQKRKEELFNHYKAKLDRLNSKEEKLKREVESKIPPQYHEFKPEIINSYTRFVINELMPPLYDAFEKEVREQYMR